MAIDLAGLAYLVGALRDNGYTVVGPTVRDEAIVLAELDSADQLPAGWGVTAEPGRYRLVRRQDGALFGHSAGPGSWKSFLHPARTRVWSAHRTEEGFTCTPDQSPPPRYAFLGVRPCDLAAIRVLDRVLAGGTHQDPTYTARRDGVFVVAVNCTEPGASCFCASMGTGPGSGPGYDLSLTEQLDEHGHDFLVDIGSPAGRALLDSVPLQPAPPARVAAARTAVSAASDRMGRAMPAGDLRGLMAASRESPHWDDVASRCLTCANCTLVCPTCFCTTTEDVTDLTGEHAERWQRWDSCFDLDFSYLHGGPVRTSGASRYRQWLTHKLGSWHDQFGGSGCVGCGRCTVWCPVGIDLTAEVARLAELAEGGSDDQDR